jgi:hypothetical protein
MIDPSIRTSGIM